MIFDTEYFFKKFLTNKIAQQPLNNKMHLKKLFPKKSIKFMLFEITFLVAFCHKDKIYAKICIFYNHHGLFQEIHLLFSGFWEFTTLLG
jgi:hypothetical protein